MANINIEIVELAPMLAMSSYFFGQDPEINAMKILTKWAGPKKFLTDSEKHPIFGFNNPPPSGEGEPYGYEYWMKIDAAIAPPNDLRVIFFKGGKYAMARCEVKGDPQNIMQTWMQLMEWVKTSDYKLGFHQGLEKHLTGIEDMQKMVLELYLPIQK